jgi:guanine deaminase
VVPGTINGHQHSHEHFQKGRLENLLRDHLDAVFQACEDIGIRALVGLAMFDKPVDSHFPWVEDACTPDALEMLRAIPVPDRAALLALSDELARSKHPHRHRVGSVLWASAPHRCTDGFLREIRALADRHARPATVHVQETRLQVVRGGLFYGRTMIEHLDLLARSGATARHDPRINLLLGAGVQLLRALLDAGVNVSLGSDGTASSMTTNMHIVMGSAAALYKVREADLGQWVDAREVFAAATVGGARALGYGDRLGTLAPGSLADLAGYRLDAPSLLPLNDAVRQLVYAERGQGLDLMVVDGELAMQDGRLGLPRP